MLITPTTLGNASQYPRFDCQAESTGGGGSALGAHARTERVAIAMVPMLEAATVDKARALLNGGAALLPLPYSLVPPAYGDRDRPWVSRKRDGKYTKETEFEQADRFGKTTASAHLYGRDKDGRFAA